MCLPCRNGSSLGRPATEQILKKTRRQDWTTTDGIWYLRNSVFLSAGRPQTMYSSDCIVRKAKNLETSILQTLQEQFRSRTVLRLHIPVPNPMHPLAQLLGQLLRIGFDSRRAHGEKQSRFPTRLDHTLGPRAANLVVCVEHVRDLP